MGFSRQEHWSGLLCPPPGDLSDPRIEPGGLLHCRQILYYLSHQGRPTEIKVIKFPIQMSICESGNLALFFLSILEFITNLKVRLLLTQFTELILTPIISSKYMA